MSQTKVQLIQPIGVMTAPGVNVSGTLTATTFDGNLTGAASSIIGTPNVNAGIITAVSFYGNGENLTGVAGSTFIGVVTAAQSGTTTIDLSLGNIIYFTQDTDTTVAFANTESTQVVDFIRTKDDTTTPRSITWPDSVLWNGGTAPTLIDSSVADDVQIFKFITRDQGVTWYGYEAMKNDPAEPSALFVMGGYNQFLAQNDDIPRSSPVQIPGTNWVSVFMGYARGGGIKEDGTLWMWGSGGAGTLGQNEGTSIPRSSPIQIPGTQWSLLSGQHDAHAAIKTDGTLWTWGEGQYGKLGLNDAENRSSPHQVPGTQWSVLSKGFHGFHALKTDGTLWSFGSNTSGYLGLNDVINRSSPTQVPGNQWSTISKTYYHSLATKTDGTLWTWGSAGQGRNGVNDNVQRSSPIQVPGTQWTTNQDLITTSSTSSLVAKTDGTLWVWGNNGYGTLGLNDRVQYSSPRQISGTGWSRIRGGMIFQNNVSAIKTDGTLWIWGSDNGGSMGQNTQGIQYSSPVQIPGTQWSKNDTGGPIAAIRG